MIMMMMMSSCDVFDYSYDFYNNYIVEDWDFVIIRGYYFSVVTYNWTSLI